MKKKYLITNFSKLIFKKNSNLIFENEYLKKLYDEKELKNYKSSSIENLNQVYNRKVDIIFCKNKIKRYIQEISPILNKLNKTKLKKKEWATLLEYFLYISIIHLKRRFETFKKIKDKKNILVEANNHSFFFENSANYKISQLENIEFNKYTNYLLAKNFKLKYINVLKNKKIISTENRTQKSIYKKLFYFIFYYLCIFLKPIIIFDGYFGKKNALKIILKSNFTKQH